MARSVWCAGMLLVGAVVTGAIAQSEPPAIGTPAEGVAQASPADLPDGVDASEPAEPVAKESREVPEEILKKLADEKYKERAAAHQRLLEWGRKDLAASIESLYRVYRNADHPEVRLRSREVLKRLVIIKQPFEGQGYLGIQMEPAQWKDPDGRLLPAVRVTVVREGTAAEVAKLQVNDLVIGVDEEVFDDLAPTRVFADYICSKSPGDEVTLRIRRGEEALTLKASLRRRSPLLDPFNQRWGSPLELPEQSEMDESDFRDWLRMREAAERIKEQS